MDSRIATVTAHFEKNIKEVILKGYIGASGRFDIETFKIDFTKFVCDKENKANDDELARRMAGASLGSDGR